jgi:hypothetical protein
MAKWLITAPNEFVADMICQRLVEGGVQPLSLGTSSRPSSLAGGRDVYVGDGELDLARQISRKRKPLAKMSNRLEKRY